MKPKHNQWITFTDGIQAVYGSPDVFNDGWHHIRILQDGKLHNGYCRQDALVDAKLGPIYHEREAL